MDEQLNGSNGNSSNGSEPPVGRNVPSSEERNGTSRRHSWSAEAVAAEDARRREELQSRRLLVRLRRLLDTARRRRPQHTVVGVPTAIALVLAAVAVGAILDSDAPILLPAPVASDAAAAPGAGAGAASLATGAVSPVVIDPNAPRLCTLPEERGAGEGDDLYNGTDPNRNLLPYSPFRIINYPCANFPGDLRVALLYRDAVVLVEGGAVLRAIPFDASGPVPLPAVVDAVNDPDWMVEVSEGVFEIDTALVQLGGTSLTMVRPEVNEVRFTTRRDVFLGGRGATARIEGVRITSWDPERGGPDENPDDGRAFILYEAGSRLDIVDSEIVWLGSDRSGAYGTSWRTGGTTGSSIGTVYDRNWFGVYTFEARDIVFRQNTFSNNVYYGLDPHDYSSGLVVEDNVAFGNGSHGLIFSRGVVDSVMRGNHSYDNGGNGIVLDLESDRNVIEDNLVENNRKDGIVLLGSGDSQILDNTIRGNRTAIRVNQSGSSGIVIEGNVMEANNAGIHAYGGAADLTITDNIIRNTSKPAIIVEAGPTSISNVEISGAPVGIEARTATEITGVSITDVDVGVIARDTGIVEVKNSTIDADDIGVLLNKGAAAAIGERLRIDAAVGVDVPVGRPTWRSYLPYVGLVVLGVAVLLELLRGARTAGETDRLAPVGVVNVR